MMMMSAGTGPGIFSRLQVELFLAVCAAEIIGSTLKFTAGCGFNFF
jgi:hypothetical protein